jgi:hypothetical protein
MKEQYNLKIHNQKCYRSNNYFQNDRLHDQSIQVNRQEVFNEGEYEGKLEDERKHATQEIMIIDEKSKEIELYE